MDINFARRIIATSVESLKARVEEVNRLNVFPVPDGDTGTNMSLTLAAVLDDVAKVSDSGSLEDICKAATHGSLMGARGNSGVITSQIIRGLCEGLLEAQEESEAEVFAQALERAKTVSYQAVRKPVEGTILTVISDMALAARAGANAGMSYEDLLESVVAESYASVKRTPDLLPVLKEAGVVDAGGFGLAIAFDAFVAALLGRATIEVEVPSVSAERSTEMTVVPFDDWDDDEYLYCTEFLLFGKSIDQEDFHDFIASVGGSELVVGGDGEFKVHVHTNDPSQVLAEALTLGEVAEVHIHNMRRQQAERPGSRAKDLPEKEIGIIAVSSGSGNEEIFKSLGADVVVSGGQTMNPSTADLVKATEEINAKAYLFLPNNSNIILAAQAATEVLEKPSAVIPTRSIPEGYAALFAYIPEGDFDELVDEMSAAAEEVKTAEVTVAVKNAKSKAGDIKAGQIIGITNGKEIESVGEELIPVTLDILSKLVGDFDESITIIFGDDIKGDAGDEIESAVSVAYPDMDVETHRGDQPLYPILLAVE